MPKIPVIFVSSIFVLCASIGVGLYLYEAKPKTLPVLGDAPEFTLLDSTGEEFRSSSLERKVWVLNFFFSHCPSVCPLINKNVTSLVKRFSAFSNIHFVSVSVDPERDTSEVLSSYAAQWGADTSKWHLVTGKTEDIQKLATQGFKLESTEKPDLHTTRLVLVDQYRKIRGYYDGLDQESIEKLRKDILKIVLR